MRHLRIGVLAKQPGTTAPTRRFYCGEPTGGAGAKRPFSLTGASHEVCHPLAPRTQTSSKRFSPKVVAFLLWIQRPDDGRKLASLAGWATSPDTPESKSYFN